MVLFHAANAPGGVYLGLFLERDLHAAPSQLAMAFVVSMAAWMLVVRPAGRLSDRWGGDRSHPRDQFPHQLHAVCGAGVHWATFLRERPDGTGGALGVRCWQWCLPA